MFLFEEKPGYVGSYFPYTSTFYGNLLFVLIFITFVGIFKANQLLL